MMPGAVLAPRDIGQKIINSPSAPRFPVCKRSSGGGGERMKEAEQHMLSLPKHKKSYKSKKRDSVLKFRPCTEEEGGEGERRKGNKGGPPDRPGPFHSFALQCVYYVYFFLLGLFFRAKKCSRNSNLAKKCTSAWVHKKAFGTVRKYLLTRGISGALANVTSAH